MIGRACINKCVRAHISNVIDVVISLLIEMTFLKMCECACVHLSIDCFAIQFNYVRSFLRYKWPLATAINTRARQHILYALQIAHQDKPFM